MKTYGELLSRHDVEIPPHLVAQAEVPVLTGPQRQGDLMVVPAEQGRWHDTEPGGREYQAVGAGVQVVHGEATGNTHWLHGSAGVMWARLDAGQVVGLVDVPEGETAYLVHTDEHGANGLGPGRYEIRRKREQAEEIRLVAD